MKTNYIQLTEYRKYMCFLTEFNTVFRLDKYLLFKTQNHKKETSILLFNQTRNEFNILKNVPNYMCCWLAVLLSIPQFS